jgi:predicted phosphodiesterase
MIQGELVKEYLSKWPDLNSLTLARLIYKENPETFTDIESTRNRIRYYRGNSGEVHKGFLKDKKFLRTDGDERRMNPYRLPLNDEIEYKPYYIPIAQNNILLLNDFHIRNHNIPAISAAIEFGIRKNINTIIIGGDFFDFYKGSDFIHDPRKPGIPEEIDMGAEFLDSLREVFPDVIFYFIVGNHDYRIERYLMIKAPELYGISDFQLDQILRFGERKINYITNKRIVKAGGLNILHGHEFGGNSRNIPVNPARTISLKAKEPTIVGHWHQTSEHPAKTLNGTFFSCFSTGCLCDLHPEYRPINDWNHGFAHIRTEEDGSFKCYNARIFEGKVL